MIYGNDIILGHIPGGSSPLTLSSEARSMHLYVPGATGSGKSKLLEGCIRQDIRSWSRSGSGLMLIDPHGSLYQSVTEFLAHHDLEHVPVIPLDLRRDDWITSYNLLRPRPKEEADMAVVVAGFVRAIAYAWGVSDLSATPLLARWLWTILASLYEEKLTLGESLRLIRSPDYRRRIARKVQDPVARSVWEMSASLKEVEFQEQLSSTVNRVIKFLSTQVMRATLCQTGKSLDLSAAIRDGAIVLVSLATEGSRVDDEDAAALGCVLLADLWSAARSRGKHERGPAELVKPFYCYIDEFQEFVTPTMAKTLDQARGFGLHFTMAHQTPRQLIDKGVHGTQLFNSIMANARTKVVFQMEHPEDLPILAEWLYRNQIDPNQIKYQGYSTKVLDHDVRYMDSYSTTQTNGIGGGSNWSETESESASEGTNWSDTDTESTTLGTSTSHTDSKSTGQSKGRNRSQGENDGESEEESSSSGSNRSRGSNWGEDEGESESDGTGTSRSTSVSRSLGLPSNALKDDLDDWDEDYHDLMNVLGSNGKEDGKRVERLDEASERVAVSETLGETGSNTRNKSSGRSRGGSESEGDSDGESHGHGRSHGSSRSTGESESVDTSLSSSDTTSINESVTTGSSHTLGGSESTTHGTANMRGGNSSWQNSTANGTSSSPMLFPILGKEASTPVFRSIEEQLFIATQKLASQPRRHCTVRVVGTTVPVQLITLKVDPIRVSDRWSHWWMNALYGRVDCTLQMFEALDRIRQRELLLETDDADMGPTTSKRRV